MAIVNMYIYIDGKKEKLPAYKNVIFKDFSSVVLDCGQDGIQAEDPKNITRFDIHFNGEKVPLSHFQLSAYFRPIGKTSADGHTVSVPKFNLANFDTSSMTKLDFAFTYNTLLTELDDIQSWDVSNCLTFYATFYGCSHITSLDLRGWDLNPAAYLREFFSAMYNLSNLLLGPGFGKQNCTTINLSNTNKTLTAATYNSMLNMYDRAAAGLSNCTITFSASHNIPDGWADKMTAKGYTIQIS